MDHIDLSNHPSGYTELAEMLDSFVNKLNLLEEGDPRAQEIFTLLRDLENKGTPDFERDIGNCSVEINRALSIIIADAQKKFDSIFEKSKLN